MEPITITLYLIAIIGFIAAGFYTIKLARETKGEKYWIFFTVAALALALHQIMDLLEHVEFVVDLHDLQISLILHIIAGVSMGYAAYGIVKTMTKIRKKVE